MKLTKEQKLEAYTFAMLIELSNEGVETHQFYCVCDSLGMWFNNGERCFFIPYGLTLFPEFLSQKKKDIPKESKWWALHDPERLAAIERAIELTEKLPL